MKKVLCILVVMAGLMIPLKSWAQQWGITTNALYWLTLTPNVGAELSFHPKMSVAGTIQYNPFTFGDNRKMKHLLGQLEYRYWLSESFKGHYLGVHATGGQYNLGNWPLGSLKDYRYEGMLAGGGFTYGYQWILSSRLNLGVELGVGYLYMSYDKFFCPVCGERVETYHTNYLGPTKVGVSLIYMLK